ncbi:hypothetical protein GN958_ATG02663 [Phytophthora infestans]|uniref:Uncharacterized protein n=1 Tax=Phytophthora infestans TaxID=4787 RepID=A0A8S9VAC0_PHYIN|nr:hypothetical protein GN958_ATG02663 [Phytophthora infestans]
MSIFARTFEATGTRDSSPPVAKQTSGSNPEGDNLACYICMADSDDLPPYPSHDKVTRAQYDTAELARVQIRQNARQLRNQARPAEHKLPPFAVHNQSSLAAHNAEQITRSRQEEQAAHLIIHGQQRVTRKTTAKLRRSREDWSGNERWKSHALRALYRAKTSVVKSTDNDRALAEAIGAEEDADALKDADHLPSPDGTDDSDFHDVTQEKKVNDVYDAVEGSSEKCVLLYVSGL